MTLPLVQGMAQDAVLPGGYTFRFTALDVNGAVVTAVKVSNASIFADASTLVGLAFGSFMLVPGPAA